MTAEIAVEALTEAEAKAELARLAAELKRHDETYYGDDAPQIDDAQYDALRQRNREIEARFPALRRSDSPENRVGAKPREGFAQVEHRAPMLSLSNAFSREDVEEFVDRVYGASCPLPNPNPSRSSPNRRSTACRPRSTTATARSFWARPAATAPSART